MSLQERSRPDHRWLLTLSTATCCSSCCCGPITVAPHVVCGILSTDQRMFLTPIHAMYVQNLQCEFIHGHIMKPLGASWVKTSLLLPHPNQACCVKRLQHNVSTLGLHTSRPSGDSGQVTCLAVFLAKQWWLFTFGFRTACVEVAHCDACCVFYSMRPLLHTSSGRTFLLTRPHSLAPSCFSRDCVDPRPLSCGCFCFVISVGATETGSGSTC